ncbi:GIN domain-containing protein [Winogradskyella aquimaris]|uniref:DUF2807 domain-containing protein n=1 Tax=Winogradskyella aquimaris TaxID=864074 RepID=A0ABU5EP89_9FLAO|nr:DUF2807 domain-containing protein [Winogradskyella aquimaris]MDY2588162.1 DUF2807 domain-containing protein [Winogradskyella aquimaris]
MRYFLFILTLVVVSPMLNAQEKIKGDRNVTIKQTYIDDFKTLVVNGDFSIEIVYNSKPSVTVETDDNLHEVIQFEVVDGVLSFTETIRITSKKRLNITVNYGDALENIIVRGDGEVRSLTSMELKSASLETADNARAYLNINSTNFSYKSSGKSKTRLNLTADSTKIELSDNSKLDALINSKVADFDLYQRSDAAIEGSVKNSILRLDNSSNFNSPNLDVKSVIATLEDNSDLTISATEKIMISASGDTELYLFGNPAITITKFEDNAKLQKKQR